MDITIQVKGFDELAAKLDNPELLGVPFRNFLDKTTLALQRNVRQLTPVDTGRLRGSIMASVDYATIPLWGEVGTGVEYAQVVEEGGRPHWTSWTNLNEWAYRHNTNVWAVTAGIAKHGTRAHHMFELSAAYIKSKLPDYVADLAKDIEGEFGK